MSLGTSIFLSVIFLGIIALFIATKDRWKWRKIIITLIIAIFVVSVVTGVSLYIYPKVTNRPKAQISFWNISLSSPKEDIKFVKGEPEKVEDDGIWIYSDYIVRFRDSKLRYVAYKGSDQFSSPDLQGLRLYSNREEIIKKLGTPSHIDKSRELYRIFSFERYNVFFILEQNKVVSYGMYNPEFGPIEFEKEEDKSSKK